MVDPSSAASSETDEVLWNTKESPNTGDADRGRVIRISG